MKLNTIFQQLTYGELSQLSIGGGAAGEISEDNYERVLVHITLGLTSLFRRFSLKEGRLLVPLVAGVPLYNTALLAPDLLKIERVLTDDGVELPLNDLSHKYSASTPSMSKLRVPVAVADQGPDLPDWLKTSNLELVYRANHPALPAGDSINPLVVEIELPDSHLEALLLFVASRVNNPIGMTNEFHAGNSYAAKYEAACQELESLNLEIDQDSQNTRLRKNGWA